MAADADAAAQRVAAYLRDSRITDHVHIAVNAVVKTQPSDALGALISELRRRQPAPAIVKAVGREVLDSRGNPTVECDIIVHVDGQDKLVGRQDAPSGASKGDNEAVELRDEENKKRYNGKGVLQAAANIAQHVNEAIRGKPITAQREIDEALLAKDRSIVAGRKEGIFGGLGGNAATAVSFAVAEGAAFVQDVQIFEHLARIFHGNNVPEKFSLPRPMVNILNGGKHAGTELQVQEFMIVPAAGRSFRENLRAVTEVYHKLGELVVERCKSKSARNVGDEGGFAPPLSDPEEVLTIIEDAIAKAGYKAGTDIFLAIDAAASEFFIKDKAAYKLYPNKPPLSTDEMVQFWVNLKKSHPALISIEDGLAQHDVDGWAKLTRAFAEQKEGVMVVGDDLYTTNTETIKKGIAGKWANALLLKVNQIGTISQAMDAARLIFEDRGSVIVSHRSGDTTGSLISDLAVAIGAQFIKTGATARGERIAKYNRLLQIEEYLAERNRLKL